MSPTSATGPGIPVPEMAGLSLAPSPPPRPMPPPRPSATSKPLTSPRAPPAPVEADQDEYASEDEDDPFADRNALVTPRVEKDEPKW